ncbi:MAG: class I SAM-dependent methyltransferase [candidate division NC10 bacterium]|nr:class I SAM-dependent methyltransferase [candidate division NC10 bacterium]
MSALFDDKREAIEQWTRDPCGFSGAEGVEVGTKAFYERVDANRYDEYGPWMKSTLEFACFAGKRLLEVGFGMGTDLFQFASSGALASGVDLSPTHLQIASQRFSLYGVPADLRLADAENLPFKDGAFDVVYTFGVIHHTPNTQKAAEEIYRVLKPGGRAIIGVYHRYSAFFLSSVLLESYLLRLGCLRESYRRTLSRIEVRRHSDACPLVKVYSRGSLRRLLRRFPVVQIECAHLDRSHFGTLGRLVPDGIVGWLERRQRMGWYLIAKCTK